ncbi:MAG: endopeptidase La [Lachnospiraceae bacterium]|nr:endopeptidase La [Lachnospiraceae bacterium]
MEQIENRMILPAIALRGITILPDTVIHFDLSRTKSIHAAQKAMQTEEQRIFLTTQKDVDVDNPGFVDVHEVGTVAIVKQITKLSDQIFRILVEGVGRARIYSFTEDSTEYLEAEVEMVEDSNLPEENEEEAMIRTLEDLFVNYREFYPKTGKSFAETFRETYRLGKLIDRLTANMPISCENKQRILETLDLQKRYEVMSLILSNEIEIAKVKYDLSERLREKVNKNQKEYLLKEQLRFIREELGEAESHLTEVEQFEEALEKLKAKPEIKEKIAKEIRRFKNSASSSSESAVERTHIETLLELPWDAVSKDSLSLNKAEQILNEQHYGLEQVKERILEFLAVRALTKRGESPIICLVGPPGTGKTSIARSVADALNKKYVRICLGGVRDEAEIRGHRKTYVGAMPGRIAVALKQAGVKNPLMLLDEIDKVGSDHKGDTASALLEVLDSEQNSHFRDHYIELPLDLSQVLFIATANSTATIPRPLLDRMEIIELTSYTANEKFHIAKEHLVKKQLNKNGLQDGKLTISDAALEQIIQAYTKEAGVRALERKIGELCRKAAKEILQKDVESIRITQGNLAKYLGKEKYSITKMNESDEVGIVRGLAWTSVGGDTLQIEVNVMPGKGEMELTGQMGDVMKESAMIAMSYVRSISSEYKITHDMFEKNDFHIHIPEGAVPKDGPSAGVTMATAILSAVTNIPVKANLAMTGEVTLRGKVLPIGGLKEKLLAAKTAGITNVLVPKKNEKDIEEVSKEIKSGINITYVETMKEVITNAFC